MFESAIVSEDPKELVWLGAWLSDIKVGKLADWVIVDISTGDCVVACTADAVSLPA
jgi:hypothetical protein